MWTSPTWRGCVCPALQERRGRDFTERPLWSQYPSNQSQPGQQEGRRGDPWSAWCAENTRGAHSEQSTCCLFSNPAACRLLEIYDSFSVNSFRAPSWCNTLMMDGGFPLPTSHHVLLTLSPGHQFSFSYKALLLNKQWAHFSKSMKLPSSLERDILTTNHAYYFSM